MEGVRLCIAGVAAAVAIAAVSAGCGPAAAAKPPPTAGDSRTYHVSVTTPGVPRGGHQVETAWLDPAGRRYAIRTVMRFSASGGGMQTITTADVGRPGVDESRTTFAGRYAPGPQTTLAYGSAVPMVSLGVAGPAPDSPLAMLRAYLGFPGAHLARMRVVHSGGRVQLVLPLPPLPAQAFADASPSLRRTLQTLAHGRVVVTILGSITAAEASNRNLFVIDLGRADQIIRPTSPGTPPQSPRPAYWLGPDWNGTTATGALLTTFAHPPQPASYDVWYARAGPAGPPAPLSGLDINTTAPPAPPGGMQPGGFPPGPHAVRIRLADGERAWFSYVLSGPVKASRTPGRGTVTYGNDGSTGDFTPPGGIPPMILVTTARSMISIQAPGYVSRAGALAIARALRPV